MPAVDINIDNNASWKIFKVLYRVFEARNHWFISYHFYHYGKLLMTNWIYDICLLYIGNISSGFGIVGLQTDNTLFLSNKIFAIKKKEQLHKTNLLAKKREKLGNKIIKFNNGYFIHKSNIIHLIQKR